ncbi:MAG TPA: O-antigen ligase domain-containing protein, partial [Planctomycetota bacterium]|nr:O-antigen ligase domain-containing protein [Planctomycetota bacterium]
FSSLSNDLGFYDGFTTMFYQSITWGVPYLLGRIYLSELIGMRDLAIGIFMGGLLYVPLCLLEVRLSPQLHTWIYGFFPHDSFDQSLRYGGYRPTVFMEHGLMVAMWMSMASLCGLWLWHSRTLRSLFGIALPWFLVPLLLTTILCKSMGPLVLLLVGGIVLLATRWGRTRAFVTALACAPLLYFAVRIPAIWSGDELTQTAAAVSPDRAKSLQFRLANEDMLLARARLRPLLGWGGWGRARIRDSQGRDISVTDGLWIIALGNNGLLGLGSLAAVLVSPIFGLFRRIPLPAWSHPMAAPAVVLSVMVLLYLIDCVFNDMKNPAYVMAGGGLVGLKLGKVIKSPLKAARVEDVRWVPRSSS